MGVYKNRVINLGRVTMRDFESKYNEISEKSGTNIKCSNLFPIMIGNSGEQVYDAVLFVSQWFAQDKELGGFKQ